MHTLLSCIGYMGLLLFTAHALLYANLLRERRKGPTPIVPLRQIPLCIIQATLALIVIYCLYPFRRIMFRSEKWPYSAVRAPLILVHPALHNAASWLLYRHFLRKAGYGNIHYFEYSCREASFTDTARRLARLVDAVSAAHPDKRPILIGASLGALIARAAVPYLDISWQLGGIITLACPHKGTRLATLVPASLFPLLRAITHQSKAITQIAAQERETPQPNFHRLAFFSNMDELVQPASALTPPSGWESLPTTPISHISIMLHIPTAKAVARTLVQWENAG